jgi:DnaJ-domain-containing protein 1
MSDYRITTNKSWAETHHEMEVELERWSKLRGGADVEWSLSRKGTTAILRYQHVGEQPVQLTMESQTTLEANARVLYLAIEALRKNEARGIAGLLRTAYLALPSAGEDPYAVLGLSPSASSEVIRAAWKAELAKHHPDRGGDAEQFRRVNRAYDALKGEPA